MTAPSSAYPAPVAELIPAARELAEQIGAQPSRNRLMREFKIGDKKANAILAALAPQPEPALEVEPVPVSSARPAPRRASRPLRPGRQRPARRLMAHQRPVRATIEPAQSIEDAQPITVPAPAAEPEHATEPESEPATPSAVVAPQPAALVTVDVAPDAPAEPAPATTARRPVRSWPLLVLAAGAFVAIWSGWVGLGELTGFGVVHPLPGIADGFRINSAITLPLGMESYAAYALRVWLSGAVPARARRFAKWSAIGSLMLGALGQVIYHLLSAAHVTSAPWPVTCAVACFPVAVLGMGAALAHLIRDGEVAPA